MEAKEIVGGIVGITVVLLLIGFLLPVGYTAYHDDSVDHSTTLNYPGTITAIGQTVSINLTAVNASDNATFSIYESGALIDTQLIDLSATGTYVCPGGSVLVTPSVITAHLATVSISIDTQFGWEDGESAMFDVLGTLVIIALLIMVISFGTKDT